MPTVPSGGDGGHEGPEGTRDVAQALASLEQVRAENVRLRRELAQHRLLTQQAETGLQVAQSQLFEAQATKTVAEQRLQALANGSWSQRRRLRKQLREELS